MKNVAVALSLMAAMLDVARTPERHPSRSSSFDWLSDVRGRLTILEEHGTDAARELLRSDLLQIPAGRYTPQPPATGARSVR